MVWDFAEANPFSHSTGNWDGALNWIAKCLLKLPLDAIVGEVSQADSSATIHEGSEVAVATDPPYYDNIIYADISDFFYVWLRSSLQNIYPREFETLVTPKRPELVAAAYRHDGDKKKAAKHFEQGMSSAFQHIRQASTSRVPTTLFYAYKQTETLSKDGGAISTGWEVMLEGLTSQGFTITATWPIRTEKGNRPVASGTNALASSVVIACRPRPDDAPIATLPEFNRALQSELPDALRHMIGGHISPVDLPQATIGPGMAVYSRYSAVLEPDGTPLGVRRALQMINDAVEQFFAEREGGFDPRTQFCLRWFEQHAFADGDFGDAETMARAKDIAVAGMDDVLQSGASNVALFPLARYRETYAEWRPSQGASVWAACHYLAAALADDGVAAAARLARRLGGLASQAIDLAYRLYAICDQQGWSQEARPYNALADSWPQIQTELASLESGESGQQAEFNA